MVAVIVEAQKDLIINWDYFFQKANAATSKEDNPNL